MDNVFRATLPVKECYEVGICLGVLKDINLSNQVGSAWEIYNLSTKSFSRLS